MARREKKYHYIYRTTNKLTKRYYIGMHSTDDLEDGYLGSGKILSRSIRKHGREHFNKDILEYCDNRSDLINKEIEYITEDVVKDKLCMNIRLGGEVWNNTNTVIVKNKFGKKFMVFNDDPRYLSGELVGSNKGNVIAKDIYGNKKYISINDPRYLSGELIHNNVGIKHSEETKQKLKMSHKLYGHQVGAKNSMANTSWIFSNDGNIRRYVKNEHLIYYLADGWKKENPNKSYNKSIYKPGELCKLKSDEKWEPYKELVLNSNIDFSKYGWVSKVSEILGISSQKVNKWMIRYLPEFYEEICFKRKINKGT